MLKTLFKSLLLCITFALTLTACKEQQKASAEIGAKPKQMIDKATQAVESIEAAQALTLEKIDAIDGETE
ncbi:MAG: hypothetical protein COB34_00150 [Methylophilaceae bacterium]|nr:MAG: hypothetical protein COB34_00150 [Methylophilaceae bacterium]